MSLQPTARRMQNSLVLFLRGACLPVLRGIRVLDASTDALFTVETNCMACNYPLELMRTCRY